MFEDEFLFATHKLLWGLVPVRHRSEMKDATEVYRIDFIPRGLIHLLTERQELLLILLHDGEVGADRAFHLGLGRAELEGQS